MEKRDEICLLLASLLLFVSLFSVVGHSSLNLLFLSGGLFLGCFGSSGHWEENIDIIHFDASVAIPALAGLFMQS